MSGVVSTIAGSTSGLADGFGTAAKFNYPWYLAVNSQGSIFVTDNSNQRIRAITSSGIGFQILPCLQLLCLFGNDILPFACCILYFLIL